MRLAYRLFLRREPESAAVVAQMAGTPLRHLVLTFVSSDEFDAAIIQPLTVGLPLQAPNALPEVTDFDARLPAFLGLPADLFAARGDAWDLLRHVIRSAPVQDALVGRHGSEMGRTLLAALQAQPSGDAGPKSRPAQASDIEQAYRLFLGRAVESQAVIDDKLGRPMGLLVAEIVGSEEFSDRMFHPLSAGEPGSPEQVAALPVGWTQAFLSALDVDPPEHGPGSDGLELLLLALASPLLRTVLSRKHGRSAEQAFNAAVQARLEEVARQKQAKRAVLGELQGRATGLRMLDCSPIALADGGLVALSNDPWMIVELHPEMKQTPLACMRLRFRPSAAPPSKVKVYFGRDGGFSEAQHIAFWSLQESCSLFICAPAYIDRLRIDPSESSGPFGLLGVDVFPVGPELAVQTATRDAKDPSDAPYAARLAKRLMRGLQEAPPHNGADAFAMTRALAQGCFSWMEGYDGYAAWMARYEQPEAEDYDRMADMERGFALRPRFSFVVPLYNTPEVWLQRCMASMLAQTYSDFEICVCDDNSPAAHVAAYMENLAAADPRVKFCQRRTNGHISEASNTALSMATGDYIVLVDHDDEIPAYTLFTVARYINENPQAAILFSDEDKIDVEGVRSSPYLKSEFNEFLMYGHNMVSHLGIYQRSLVETVGGFRRTLEGSQDYDLFLRCHEQLEPGRTVHIPHVLYHWRMIPGSTSIAPDQKSYAIAAARSAINGHFERSGRPLRCVDGLTQGVTAITHVRSLTTSISIIIPTRDGLDVLKPCVDSVLATADQAVEMIIVDNGSERPETLSYLDDLSRTGQAQVIKAPGPFNFSTINNHAADLSKGEIICFLNNDTEVVSPAWLDHARGLLAIAQVGGVGARLLFPDHTLQHMGVVLGMGAHGVAGTPHGGVHSQDPGYFGKAWLAAEFSAVTAACLFVRRSDFNAVGGFDPELAVAYNDVDLCLKLRARGLKIVCDPGLTLIHKESRTRGYDKDDARARRIAAEAQVMKARWGSVLARDPYYSPNLSLETSNFQLACPPRVARPWDLQAAPDDAPDRTDSQRLSPSVP